MPIREYICAACGQRIERLQKLAEAPLTDCPSCGEAELTRKISAVGFRLSGGGWYETDFKADRRRNLAGDGAEGSAETSQASDRAGKEPGAPETSADKSAASVQDNRGEHKQTGESKSASKRDGGSKGSSETASSGNAKPASSPSKDKA